MKTYHKQYFLNAPCDDVYAALTNPVTLELWTGEKAEMSTIPGSEFSLWEGSIEGRNLEFEPGRKLVQQWYFGDQEEPSVVTILLSDKGKGTTVELIHTNIPDEVYKDITAGWDQSYFGQLRDFYRE